MNGDLIGAVVRLLVALPLILGIAYLVLKYGLARRYMVTTGNRRMKLVEQLPLGPKTSLSLVSLGGKYYLLAHQDNSVSLVKELDEIKEPEETIIGDIVELRPRTLRELDRLRKPVGAGITGELPGFFKEKCRHRLHKFKDFLSAKLAAGKSSGNRE
ncbi:Flagellar biosynthesis protein, FliO [Pelotomaculum sp. FP]|uniref:flagellar biosynthetic protein FliO n=1 Tax=Pelotomaculum sp. FP TaxID=261474 RepID=UPI001065647C|nr:flagellar biosynthetic protein FliO [Pelotomaculum sp. FP]TEB15932.1 Flagellar biosynthesis protein, FliO [Pelotomaculum sp. FP]